MSILAQVVEAAEKHRHFVEEKVREARSDAKARDQILAPLTEVATKNDSRKQTQSTNLTIYRPSRVGDKDRPGVAKRPKS